jgi:hypothetical protein
MIRLTSRILNAALLGQLVAQLGWIDPLFIPLVLVGPLATGAILAAHRVTYTWAAVLWASTGIGMAWSDWLVNRSDVLFHLALAVLMPLLAGIGWGVVRLASRQAAGSRVNPTVEPAHGTSSRAINPR